MNDAWAVVAAVGVLLMFSGLTSRPDRRSRITARLEETIDAAGYRNLTAVRLLVLSGAGAALAAFFAVAATGAAIVGAIAALAAGWAPFGIVRSRRERRRDGLRSAWPDALATMIAGIRAGIALPEVCASLSDRGPEELKDAFRSYAARYRASGSFPAALRQLREELADPIADRVTSALQLAHEVGGTELVRVLRTLSDFVREDLRIRREIEARWSWTVTAARVAAASPWVVLVIMATRPEAAAAFGSPGGATVIAAGAVATTLGYRLMLRAARLPEQRRLEL